MSSQPPELGPDRRGPDFAPPGNGGAGADPYRQPPYGFGYQNQSTPGFGGHPNAGSGGPQYPQRPHPQRPHPQRPPQPQGPKKDRRPAIITAALIGVVVLIVVIASIHAVHGDQQAAREQASPTPTPQPSALPSDGPNSISFTSSEGSGRLTLVSHDWTTTGAEPPRYGQFLQLELKISASDGRVSYGPEFFQTFDETGNLFQTTEVGAKPPLLADGVLHSGQTVTGDIAFDMPRGAVTLLMSNSLLESVTALRITD
ncbi:hypothetical protein GCM10011575_20940 [Microlunatus endophyticus]|uniref:DUF4352 domain-containing protein n=1 Tax=Microlunatus endophyticus TaxID=1716077 RepID=A0A917S838_9ACTN|nr:hypothetical protein [Microlunatus endophyticus]GGL62201.1 hypothetical protein GCM10011575_20940 [Microlunatus endophyticus]